jgi:hypothetical protein
VENAISKQKRGSQYGDDPGSLGGAVVGEVDEIGEPGTVAIEGAGDVGHGPALVAPQFPDGGGGGVLERDQHPVRGARVEQAHVLQVLPVVGARR